MKLLKWILILVVVCVLLAVAGILFVLNSAGFQKSLVQGVLDKQVSVREFEYFKAGFSQVTIRSLAVEKDGTLIGLEDLTLNYSLWDYLFGKEVRVDSLAVKGLVVNMRGPSIPMGPGPVIPQLSSPSEVSPGTVAEKTGSKTSSGKTELPEAPDLEPFKGLFAHGVLPFKLYVGEVAVKAQVLLPGEREVNATLSGGGIEPGADGKVEFKVIFDDAAPEAQLRQATVDGRLTLTQNDEAAITAIVLEVDVAGESSAVENAPKLAFVADLAQQPDKTESYRVTMAETSNPEAKLVSLDATFDPSGNNLKGTLNLNAADPQVAALVPADMLPAFELDGELDFDVVTTNGDGRVQGKFRLVLDQLARLREELASLGQVTLTANLQAECADRLVTLKTLDAGLASANQGQLLVLETLRAFSFKCGEGAEMPELTGDLVRLTLNALPLPLIDPWLKGIQLSGQPVSAQVLVSAEDDDTYRITLPQGLTLTDLSVVKDGQPMLDALTLAAQPTVVYSPDKATVDVTALKLTQRGVPLASGTVQIEADPSADEPEMELKAQLSGDLAQLLKQPALSAYNNVATGTFEATATLDYEDGKADFDVAATVANLLVRQPMKPVGQMMVSAKGSFENSGKLEVSAPFVLRTAEGNTDLKLKAELEKKAGVQHFDVDLTGDELGLDGLQLLASAFKNPAAQTAASTATAATPAAPTGTTAQPATAASQSTATASAQRTSGSAAQADTVPFWDGFAGQATARIDKIYVKQYQLTAATLKLVLTADRLTVDPLSATFAGAPLKSDTVIAFTPGASPYDLKSNLTFSQFDVGKFLVQAQPGATPPLTGMFSVTGTATGTGPTMNVLTQNIQGKFNLEGKDGTLRMLAAAGQEQTGNLLGFGLGVASLFQKNQRTGVQTAQRLIQILQQIDYERFSIVAERGANLDIDLSELALDGPEIRLNGTAKVKNQSGVPIPQQTLSGEVKLSAAGDAARLFSDLRMLSSSQPDADGFYDAFSFPLKGTLAKPDFSELNQKLLSAAAATAMGSDEGRMNENTGTQPDGTTTGEDSSQQQQKQKQATPEDAVRGLLQNLLK
ncbi:AsmA family protein [Ruficoccus amylovorans]|uniref:AsmA family protein n=1 Tax=Ruficoccus amylovorans TaxID=1804625 RepID=A0A842HDG6_9BACT|nr:AsmA family protein [Ruficoccus amylovorans]MBC2593726.1 AsmA family protein [Ruficoccus amylovorans]